MVHESIGNRLMNSSLLTQSMHQYTQFLIPVFYIVNNSNLNPLQCKLDVQSLISDVTVKRPQVNFLAAIARCRISHFSNLCPKCCISRFSTMLIEILISRHYVLKKRTSKTVKNQPCERQSKFPGREIFVFSQFRLKISSVRQIVTNLASK